MPLIAKTNVLGDLIMNKSGQVFISDSQGNGIYTVNEKQISFEPFYSSPDILNMQGLTFQRMKNICSSQTM